MTTFSNRQWRVCGRSYQLEVAESGTIIMSYDIWTEYRGILDKGREMGPAQVSMDKLDQ